MFVHNFKYVFKTLLKNKSLIFWTFAFPIILATFFNMAFSDIVNNEQLDIIDIAIVDNTELQNNSIYKEAFNTLSDKDNQDRLFNVTYTDLSNAKSLLEEEKIVGYLELVQNEPKLTIIKNGINQTIFKYTVDEITQTNTLIKDMVEKQIKQETMLGNNINYEKIYQYAYNITQVNDTEIKNIASHNLDYSMIEYYSLIAMACLYGGILGMVAINQNLANMSNKGKRIAIAPIKKLEIISSSILASYVIQLVGIFLLLAYTIFVLNVDYGDSVAYLVLLSCVGSFAGLALGVAIGALIKTNENNKTGILISITMALCFFAGMFGITTKYVFDKNFPLINRINPVNMITDGLYSLYYYDTLNRYWFNVISLLVCAGILILISTLSLRRQKYDSI